MTDGFDDFPGAIVSRPPFRFEIGQHPAKIASTYGLGCGAHMEAGGDIVGPYYIQAVSRDLPEYRMTDGMMGQLTGSYFECIGCYIATTLGPVNLLPFPTFNYTSQTPLDWIV